MGASYRITHLFDHTRGSRFPAMISQGLWFHPDIIPTYASPFISAGHVVRAAEKNLFDALIEANYIFRADDDHYENAAIDSFLDRENLWHKVAYYDFRDTPHLDTHRLAKVGVYLKRSWPIGFNRLPRTTLYPNLFPLDFSLLNEYFALDWPTDRDIDLAYQFIPNPIIGRRRYGVLEELRRVRGHFPNARIGRFTTAAQRGRQGIFQAIHGNPFFDYLRILRRAKIVFTAFPDMQDGDSRTWEALSSGALVLMDGTAIPSPRPPQNGIHCIMYDARDRRSVRDAIALARYYLANDEAREKIARAGYAWALNYHKPVDRISQVLSWLQSSTPQLSRHVVLTQSASFFVPATEYGFPAFIPADSPRPDFLGIGAQKAGTSWLDANLRKHPELFLPDMKELHFFDARYDRGLAWYLAQFEEGAGQLRGEITPAYAMLKSREIEQVTTLLPNLKVIFILRNPIERAWSAARMEAKRMDGKGQVDLRTVEELIFAVHIGQHDSIGKSDYRGTIERWRRFVPEERFLVLRYDDLCADPKRFFREILRFLEVDNHVDLSGFPLKEQFLPGEPLPMPPRIR
ncbi:MAG: glycosyltransferase, partial [Chitinivibrionales bacterium]|nr:glycosyltransferase [Chitinivibrionales bacterium]MBD3357226.1 glycosyltransferase [Chitinivibrionales bacterium]